MKIEMAETNGNKMKAAATVGQLIVSIVVLSLSIGGIILARAEAINKKFEYQMQLYNSNKERISILETAKVAETQAAKEFRDDMKQDMKQVKADLSDIKERFNINKK